VRHSRDGTSPQWGKLSIHLRKPICRTTTSRTKKVPFAWLEAWQGFWIIRAI